MFNSDLRSSALAGPTPLRNSIGESSSDMMRNTETHRQAQIEIDFISVADLRIRPDGS